MADVNNLLLFADFFARLLTVATAKCWIAPKMAPVSSTITPLKRAGILMLEAHLAYHWEMNCTDHKNRLLQYM